MLEIIKRIFRKIKNTKRNSNTIIENDKQLTKPLINPYKIPEPENPLSYSTAEDLCAQCIVGFLCAELCEEVKTIYKSHVVQDPNWTQFEEDIKEINVYKDIMDMNRCSRKI